MTTRAAAELGRREMKMKMLVRVVGAVAVAMILLGVVMGDVS